MVGRARVLENRVLVVLGMRRGEIPAVKIEIVFLLAVIGQRLARNLSSGNTSTVSEYRKKQGIHAGAFLKHIEHFLRAFIHKRNCSDLDADHFGGDSSMSRESAWPRRRRHRQRSSGIRGDSRPSSRMAPIVSVARIPRSSQHPEQAYLTCGSSPNFPALLHQRLIWVVIVAQRQRAIRIDLLPARPSDRITHALNFEFSFQPQPLPLDACGQHQHGLMNASRLRISGVDAA